MIFIICFQVEGHFDYSEKMDEILNFIGIKTRERRQALRMDAARGSSSYIVQPNRGNIHAGKYKTVVKAISLDFLKNCLELFTVLTIHCYHFVK